MFNVFVIKILNISEGACSNGGVSREKKSAFDAPFYCEFEGFSCQNIHLSKFLSFLKISKSFLVPNLNWTESVQQLWISPFVDCNVVLHCLDKRKSSIWDLILLMHCLSTPKISHHLSKLIGILFGRNSMWMTLWLLLYM